MMRFLIGAAVIAASVFMIMKTDSMIRMFGRSAWAEAKLGGGGTWAFYKILGVLGILLGFMIWADMWALPLDLLFGRG